ncbi:jhy protein homolog [Pelobates fuscus]|uniref:jhy protein homolog n=1 Tax=Pelobates fuscus TaxID=191477 RepID=UPI002FE434EE
MKLMESYKLPASSQDNYPDSFAKDMELNLSLDSLLDSDSDSLTQEIQYQSDLKHRISDHERPASHSSQGASGGSSNQSHNYNETENHYSRSENHHISNATVDENSSEFDKLSAQKVDVSYSSLRYNPDWKRNQSLEDISASLQELEDFSDDSLSGYDSTPEEPSLRKLERRVKQTDKLSTDHKVIGSSHKNKAPLDTATEHNKDSSVAVPSHGTREIPAMNENNKNQLGKSKNSQKDLIEKNKHTLGVRGPKAHSYLDIHKKKADEQMPTKDQKKELESIRKISSHSVTGRQLKVKCPASEQSEDTESLSTSFSTNMSDRNASGPQRYPENRTELSSKHQASESTSSFGFIDLNAYSYEELHGVNYNSEAQPPRYSLPRENQSLLYHQTISNPQSHIFLRHFHPGPEMDLEPFLQNPANSNSEFQNLGHDKNIQRHGQREGSTSYTHALSPPLHGSSGSSLIDTESEGYVNSSDSVSESDPHHIPRNKSMDKAETQRCLSFLKQEVKLGGIGPTYRVSKEKETQLQKQKAYAKLVKERNRLQKQSVPKVPESQTQENDGKKCARQKSLEYAINIPRPQPLPKICTQAKKEETPRNAVFLDNTSPQVERILELQLRHEREKIAVAAFNALHML